MMAYLPSGSRLTAAHWNDLFAEADAVINTAINGLSAVFVGADKAWERTFFLGLDPLNLDGTALHPLAYGFLDYHYFSDRLYSSAQQYLYARQYSHSAITGQLTGLTPGAYDSTRNVVQLPSPAWSAWKAAIYPTFPFADIALQATQLYYGTSTKFAARNCLDVSLAVMTAPIVPGGPPGNITFGSVLTAEHAQPMTGIDVFFTGSVTWDAAWNKYGIVRAHNCGRAAATIFDSPIPAGGSACFRKVRTAGVDIWHRQGNYFHYFFSGDGRFSRRDAVVGTYQSSVSAPAIHYPGVVANVLGRLERICGNVEFDSGPAGRYWKITSFADVSPVFNNPDAAQTPHENAPPANGYFPGLGENAPVGDFIVPRGKVLVVQQNATGDHVTLDFTGFAALPGALAAAGVSTRPLTVTTPLGQTLTTQEIYSGSAPARHLVDLSSALVTFLTGGANPARIAGGSQSSTPPSLKLPWLGYYFTAASAAPGSNTRNYDNWKLDGNGNPVIDFDNPPPPVVIANDGSGVSSITQYCFLPTQTLGEVTSALASAAAAGGVFTADSFSLWSTPFGHWLTWVEHWPLTARFNYVVTALPRTIQVILDGTELQVTRALPLDPTQAIFPPVENYSRTYDPASGYPLVFQDFPALRWHYGRVDHQFTTCRFMLSDATWLPFAGVADGAYFNLTLNYGLTVNWFENGPDENGPDGVETIGPVPVLAKPGISRPGAFQPEADVWGPFSYWLAGYPSLSYPLGNPSHPVQYSWTLATPASWYGANYGAVIDNSPLSDPNGAASLPNVLPCQVEQFNALASLVASAPKMSYTAPRIQDNSAGNPVTYLPVFQPAPVGTTLFHPRGAFFSWSAPASGADVVGDYFASAGLTIKSDLPAGSDTDDYYRWITIDDARRLYDQLNIPFTLDAIQFPVRYDADGRDDVDGTPKVWISDPAGLWVGDFGSQRLTASKTMLNYGVLPLRSEMVSAVLILRENKNDLAAVCLPENCAYYDEQWIKQHAGDHFPVNTYPPWLPDLGGGLVGVLGLRIIPIVADNTVETSAAEVKLVSGAGGVGNYETTIDTNLLNARLVALPVDGQAPAGNPPPDGGM